MAVDFLENDEVEIVQSPLCFSKSKSVEASTVTTKSPAPVATASPAEPVKTTKGEVKPFFWLPEQYLQDNPVEEAGSGSEEEKKETVQEVVDFAIRDIKSISEERFRAIIGGKVIVDNTMLINILQPPTPSR